MRMCVNCAKVWIFFLCAVLADSSGATSSTSSGYYAKNAMWTVYLDSAAKAIGKAKSISVTCRDKAGTSGQKEALMSYLDIADEMINKAKIPTIDTCYTSPKIILDCSDLLRMGHRRSGVYTISHGKKLSKKKRLDVYCDMETDGGGWTVIQRRGDFQFSVDYFFKDWKSYKEGFGDLETEFWLGNENIFTLTNQDIYIARFDLVDVDNNTRYAHFDAFWIDGENSKYTLHMFNYTGYTDPAILSSNGMKFSTKDQNNMHTEGANCALNNKGAWWFYSCFHSHLNGENLKGNISKPWQGKIWKTWKGDTESLAQTEIKIRPKNFRP